MNVAHRAKVMTGFFICRKTVELGRVLRLYSQSDDACRLFMEDCS
jgi:hypothetical protein